MAYKCPRCGGDVAKGSNVGAALVGGVLGAMLYSAFGSFQCKKCGKIAKSEFPVEDQKKMTQSTITLVVIAVVIFFALIGCIVMLAMMSQSS